MENNVIENNETASDLCKGCYPVPTPREKGSTFITTLRIV